MPTETSPAKTSPSGDFAGGLAQIVLSGAFERVHYALVLASAAAAVGRPSILFFTLDALRALCRPHTEDCPAWRALLAADGRTGGEVDDGYKAHGIGDFEQLLAACVDLKVRFLVCEMGLRALGLQPGDLRGDVPIEVTGAVSFLIDTPSDARTLVL